MRKKQSPVKELAALIYYGHLDRSDAVDELRLLGYSPKQARVLLEARL